MQIIIIKNGPFGNVLLVNLIGNIMKKSIVISLRERQPLSLIMRPQYQLVQVIMLSFLTMTIHLTPQMTSGLLIRLTAVVLLIHPVELSLLRLLIQVLWLWRRRRLSTLILVRFLVQRVLIIYLHLLRVIYLNWR